MLGRLPAIQEIPKAGGLSGQILELLRYRGLLERFEAAGGPRPPPRFPWGGLHVVGATDSRDERSPRG